jgi:filamentous hemagglutinin
MGNGVISTPNQGVNAQNGQNSIVPAPVYVNPSANSNQGLVNSQTQPITTPITSDANLQGGVIVTPEYIASPSDNITTMAGYTPNAGGVANMGKFFELNNFGGMLGSNSTKTSLSIKGSSVYKSNINIGVIKKGDLFYLDSQHKDHIEVFSASNRTSKAVLNLDGSINEPKTIGARGRVIPK